MNLDQIKHFTETMQNLAEASDDDLAGAHDLCLDMAGTAHEAGWRDLEQRYLLKFARVQDEEERRRASWLAEQWEDA